MKHPKPVSDKVDRHSCDCCGHFADKKGKAGFVKNIQKDKCSARCCKIDYDKPDDFRAMRFFFYLKRPCPIPDIAVCYACRIGKQLCGQIGYAEGRKDEKHGEINECVSGSDYPETGECGDVFFVHNGIRLFTSRLFCVGLRKSLETTLIDNVE